MRSCIWLGMVLSLTGGVHGHARNGNNVWSIYALCSYLALSVCKGASRCTDHASSGGKGLGGNVSCEDFDREENSEPRCDLEDNGRGDITRS